MKFSRVKTWLIPATGLSMAVAGVAFLAAMELSDPEGEGLALGPPVAGGGAGGPVGLSPAQARAPGEAGASGASSEWVPAPQAPAQAQAPRVQGRVVRAPVQETAKTRYAAGLVVEMARQRKLEQRLASLEHRLSLLPPKRRLDLLEGLLDSQLPGTLYEVTALRTRVVALVAEVPGEEASRVLSERLAAGIPRPERLMALEGIASRAVKGEAQHLRRLAAEERDEVVRQKAQWVLARLK